MCDVLLCVCSKMADETNLSSKLPIELELKWNKRLQIPFPPGFNDNIYYEENTSKMPDFVVFPLLDIYIY